MALANMTAARGLSVSCLNEVVAGHGKLHICGGLEGRVG